MSDPIIDPLGSYSCSTDGYSGAGWSGYGGGYGAGYGSGYGSGYGYSGSGFGYGIAGASLAAGYQKGTPRPGIPTIPSVGGWYFDPETAVILSKQADDVIAAQGLGLYQQMLGDDQVAASLALLTFAVTGGELTIEPAIVPEPGERLDDRTDPERRADIEAAALYAEEFRRSVAGVPDFLDALESVYFRGTQFGCSLAEPDWVKDGPLWVLGGLTPRPIWGWAWLMKAGKPAGVVAQTIGGPMWYPRENYLIYSNAPRDGDPRGTSDLRPAYDPWLFKTSAKPEKAGWLHRFSQPSLVLKYDPSNVRFDYPMPDGTTQAWNPQQQAAYIGQNYGNGSHLEIPLTWDATLIESKSDGGGFNAAEEAYNKAIARAILLTGTATNEAERNSVAQAGQSDNVMQTKVARRQRALADAIRRDLSAVQTVKNHGESSRHLAPRIRFKLPQHVLAELWTALSGLINAKGLPPSIAARAYVLAGLPSPNPEELESDKYPGWGQEAPPMPAPGATPMVAVGQGKGKGTEDGEMPADGKMADGKDGKPAPGKPAPPLGGKVRKVIEGNAAKDQAKE